MCAGSDYGAVASANISKGAKESFSDDGNRYYGGGGCYGGGGTTPAGKEQIAEDEEWYFSKEEFSSMIMVQLDDTIKRRGIIPKGRKDEKHNQLQICVDNEMSICQGACVEYVSVERIPPTAKQKVPEPHEEVAEEAVNEFRLPCPHHH